MRRLLTASLFCLATSALAGTPSTFNGLAGGLAGNPNIAVGTITTTKAGKDALIVSDSTSEAAGVGGSILFQGTYTTGGGVLPFGRVSLEKINSTSADYGFNLNFYGTTNGQYNPSLTPGLTVTGEGISSPSVSFVNASIDTLTATSSASGRGSVAAVSGTPIAVFSVPGAGRYDTYCYVTGFGSLIDLSSTATIISDGTTAVVRTASNGAIMATTVSGMDVQCTQTTGGSFLIYYAYSRTN